MKILPERYQCSICDAVFPIEKAALFCENCKPLLPCPVKVGDSVSIKTRYNGIHTDIVEEILIRPCLWNYDYVMAMFSDDEKHKEHCKRLNYPTHEYILKTKNEWQIGKDCYTNLISESNLDGIKLDRYKNQ